MAIRTRINKDGIRVYTPDFYVKVKGERIRVRAPEFFTSAACKAFVVDAKSRAQKGDYLAFLPSTDVVTMQQVADNWITRYALPNLKRSYNRVYRFIVPHIVDGLGKARDVQTLSTKELDDWMNGLAAKVQKQTANSWRMLLRSMFREALRAGLIKTDPTAGMLRFGRAEKQKNVYFTDSEYYKLLDACKDQDLKDIIIIFRHTGFRCGDGERVCFEHIDFNLKTIHFYDQKNGEEASIPLHPEAENRINLRAARLGRRTGLLFYANMRDWSRKFTALVREVGLYQPYPRNKTLHSLRHSWGTYLQKEYKDLNVTAAAMRHKTLKMTQRYAHAASDMLRTAMNMATAKRPETGDAILEEIKR